MLCYKADIEAALRTPGFGGFQLLDLHDFPGQGTALVGVLNPFWKDKGYVDAKAYSRFAGSVVPLARLPKMIWQNNEQLQADLEIANFGAAPLKGVTPRWTLMDKAGHLIKKGHLAARDIPLGNALPLGHIQIPLEEITQATALKLTLEVQGYQNDWDLYVYPASTPEQKGVLVTDQLGTQALSTLQAGGKVLLSISKGQLCANKGGDIALGFSSIFWNTAWTHSQPPTTLGILCDPKHKALASFPTDYYSNWQWWDPITHGAAIELDSLTTGLSPIVRVIDDWVTGRSLGLIFECKVANGTLIVAATDLLSNLEKRPVARQLRYSLTKYMNSSDFQPKQQVSIEKLQALIKTNEPK